MSSGVAIVHDHCSLYVQAQLAIWPNKDFLDKKSKFGVDVLPLEALLDYNEDDTKEGHFEVSVFAELFKEMLQTRFARGLLRALAILDHEVNTNSSWFLCSMYTACRLAAWVPSDQRITGGFIKQRTSMSLSTSIPAKCPTYIVAALS